MFASGHCIHARHLNEKHGWSCWTPWTVPTLELHDRFQDQASQCPLHEVSMRRLVAYLVGEHEDSSAPLCPKLGVLARLSSVALSMTVSHALPLWNIHDDVERLPLCMLFVISHVMLGCFSRASRLYPRASLLLKGFPLPMAKVFPEKLQTVW